MSRPRIDPAARIERRLVTEDRGYATPCRIYQGYIGPRRYPATNVGSSIDGTRRMVGVHRITYEHHHGPIPAGLVIDHLCRQRACCEITHLEAVTQGENVRRGIYGALTTHCPQGHEYTPENTSLYRGSRYCRECGRIRKRARYRARTDARGAS